MPSDKYEELMHRFNPDTLKKNLLRAAVYIIAYEFLENMLMDRLQRFFAMIVDAECIDINGNPMPRDNYVKQVRARNKDDLLVASCLWFEAEKVLTSDDVQFVKDARKHRGDLVHEMPKILLQPGNRVDITGLHRIYELASRIDVWWLSWEDAPEGSESFIPIFLRYLNEVIDEREAMSSTPTSAPN
jgi:hypothetical protein